MISSEIEKYSKFIINNFNDYVGFVEIYYNSQNDPYYRFGSDLLNCLYNNEIKYELHNIEYQNDCLSIEEWDSEKSLVSTIIALNETTDYGFQIAYEINDEFRKLFFSTSGQLTFRDDLDDDIAVFEIPKTVDEYFNISVLYDIPITLNQIKNIVSFNLTNSKIIDEYEIMIEIILREDYV